MPSPYAAGYDPRTFRNSVRCPHFGQRRHGRAVSRCPSKSTKMTYSQGRCLAGRDSILVRLIPAGRERLEDRVERARLVAHREEDRCLVAAGRAARLAADDQEAGRVAADCPRCRAEHRHAVHPARQVGGDRGHAWRRAAAHLSGGRGGERLLGRHIRQVLGQPPAALRQPLRMRQHALDPVERARPREQVLGDLERSLAADDASESISRSSVMLTAPSVVFSTGTTPYSARPRSTSSKTSRDGPRRPVASPTRRSAGARPGG